MTYTLLNSLKDPDIPRLLEIHSLPEIQCFIDINIKKYFKYVVKSENVFYYKIYDEDILVGSVHCELDSRTMYLSLLIFPEYHNKGYGTKTLEDIISKNFLLTLKALKFQSTMTTFLLCIYLKKSVSSEPQLTEDLLTILLTVRCNYGFPRKKLTCFKN